MLTGKLSGVGGVSASLSAKGNLSGRMSTPRGGTYDYEELENKPKINGVTLIGDRSFEDLGEDTMTNREIVAIFNQVFGGN